MDADNGDGIAHGSQGQAGCGGTKKKKHGTSVIAKRIKHQKMKKKIVLLA